MPFGELVCLVPHPLFDPPGTVVRFAQRLATNLAHFAEFVLIDLPQPGRRLVHNRDAGAVELIQDRQHWPDMRRYIDGNLVADPARQRNLFIQIAAAARENGNRSRLPALLRERLLDAVDVGPYRQACIMVDSLVLGQRVDLVQQAGHPRMQILAETRISVDARIYGAHGKTAAVEPDNPINCFRSQHLLTPSGRRWKPGRIPRRHESRILSPPRSGPGPQRRRSVSPQVPRSYARRSR